LSNEHQAQNTIQKKRVIHPLMSEQH